MSKNDDLAEFSKCGGCAAKLAAGSLANVLARLPKQKFDENLLVGFDTSDDASVYKITDELAIVQTVDFFPPVVDDPYMYGQIAAANAISDVYAMGGVPKTALNVLCVPKDFDEETVYQILKGGYDKAQEASVTITGGHTITDDEPKYGLSVTGFVHPDKVLTNAGAKIGDILILTKPLGFGIINTASKAEAVDLEVYQKAIKFMSTLNKYSAEIASKYEVHACTDVTGFGLMGHTLEMALASGVTVKLDKEKLPVIPEAYELAKTGILPNGVYYNRDHGERFIKADGIDEAFLDVLFDPQTSGGLLISVAEKDANALTLELSKCKNVPIAQIIGKVCPFEQNLRIIIE